MYRIFTRTLFSTLFLFTGFFSTSAQSYHSSGSDTLMGGAELRDTIEVTGLTQSILNGNFGLDSVTLNINCHWPHNLIVSLISPNGTEVNLSEHNGGSNPNFTATNFNMNATYLVAELSSPFTGSMRPDGCLNNFNDGQDGNGIWQLKVVVPNQAAFARIVDFGLHFNDSPEVPYFTSTKLPIVVVNTKDVTNPGIWPAGYKVKVNATMGIIYNGPGQDNHITDDPGHFLGNINIATRGISSSGFPQKSYSLDMKNGNWEDTNVSLLGMPAEEDWILYAPWCDKSLIRNVISYQLSSEMGRYAPRTRFCELVLDGDYKGVYVLAENIKRGSSRVAVQKLEAPDTTGADLTGGYILEIDRGGIIDSQSFVSNYLPCTGAASSIKFNFDYPKPENIQAKQKEYIRNYVDSFEYALANIDPDDIDNGYRNFIDVPSFIDFSIMQEFANNVDAYRLSTFLHKPKKGKLFAGPIWDFNIAYGSAYYYAAYGTQGFRWDLACPSSEAYLNPFWWKKLMDDPTYMHEFKCRYSELRSGPLNFAHISQMMDSLREIVEVPQQRHYQRWPIMGRYIDPNIYTGQSWDDEIAYVQNWIYGRLNYLDIAWYDPTCALSAASTQNKVAKVLLYPNPAGEYLHVEATQKSSEVVVYNEIGQVVYKSTQTALKYDIDVREWSAGIYVVEVKCEGGTVREKVTVL